MTTDNTFDLNFKSALIIGGTGLIGGYLLRNLIHHPGFDCVTSLSRKASGLESPKFQEHLIDFDRLAELDTQTYGFGADVLFITLGTTIKDAGSRAAFERVDLEYVLQTAKTAKAAGCKHCHAVTAIGADENSSVFYNRIKGKVECKLRQLEFESLHIYRPSLLLGKRRQKRTAERFGQVVMKGLMPTMLGPLRAYRPIHAETVAEAMLVRAIEAHTGEHIILSEDIKKIAAAPKERSAV